MKKKILLLPTVQIYNALFKVRQRENLIIKKLRVVCHNFRYTALNSSFIKYKFLQVKIVIKRERTVSFELISVFLMVIGDSIISMPTASTTYLNLE